MQMFLQLIKSEKKLSAVFKVKFDSYREIRLKNKVFHQGMHHILKKYQFMSVHTEVRAVISQLLTIFCLI